MPEITSDRIHEGCTELGEKLAKDKPEYIERNKIHNCLDDLSSENLIGNDNDTFISLPEAHDRIDDILPADVAEVKHGEWIKLQNGWECRCSLCGASAMYHIDSTPSNYCPNCGADMRGEKDAK